MKVEVGKCYLMVNDKVATIMEYQPGKPFPFRGMFGSEYDGGSMSWDEQGNQCNGAFEYRLIEEVPTLGPGQIEVSSEPEPFATAFAVRPKGHTGPIRWSPPTIKAPAIEVPILDGVSPEIATMAALENVMLDALSNRDLPFSSQVRVANWFAERYGDEMPGEGA